MKDRNQRVLFKEMIFDLHYRLRLADDLFCRAAEDLVAAAALEEWSSRAEAVRSIGEYSGALRVIDQDLSLIVEGKQAVFPADLPEWVFDLPDGEFKGQLHLKRLHGIAEAMELAVSRELLQMEIHHE